MEFEAAARRFEKEQSELRGRKGPPELSSKAKREAERRKKVQEKARQDRDKRRVQLQHVKQYMASCDRALGVKSLGNLKPISIYGDGDKITLPPSVLQRLTEGDDGGLMSGQSSPWTFRIGLLRPNYVFPLSDAIKGMKPGVDDIMDDSDNENDASGQRAAFLEELSYKYIVYTHGTVVEFTQEEGNVGLPSPIASALLDPLRRRSNDADMVVPVNRTVDPASSQERKMIAETVNEEERTPGHLAWGAFDVPSDEVEITLLMLPKGKECTLVPTKQAAENGFYDLKDVKLVLEQSLIRTRATLSVGDVVHTWHRGVKFDLTVSSVTPSDFAAVSCINTDIEVVIDSSDRSNQDGPLPMETDSNSKLHTSSFAGGNGRVLSSVSKPSLTESSPEPARVPSFLIPEPSVEQKEGVCTVQVRGSSGQTGRRRFDVAVAKVSDLFAFAGSVITERDLSSFRLVTRYPRNVYDLEDDKAELTMSEVGIYAGQQMMLVERK